MGKDKPPPVLYLIDGHAQIFRAYYAIRTPMTSPVTGEPTQAVFAFAGMLIKLFNQFRPQYVAMAIDLPGKTFRDELYDQYKATREPPPDDFHPQEQRIFELTKLFGIPLIGVEGAEADDVIATITRRVLDDPAAKDVFVRIVSKDKDLEQLIGQRVSMFDMHTGATIDVASLMETKGIKPQQVIDVLTLAGDKVDNIPGVDGIGPKTAAKLVQQYDSLDGVLANLDNFKGKRKENIEKAREHLSLSRQLVALKNDLDFPFTIQDAKVGAMDATTLKRLFKEMGFRRHANDLETLLGNPSKPSKRAENKEFPLFAAGLFDAGPEVRLAISDEGHASAAECTYHAVTTHEQLNDLIATLKKQTIISVDTETIGLSHHAKICGICLSWQAKHGIYVPLYSPEPEKHLKPQIVLDALRPLLEDVSLHKCGHNLKYDILVLHHAGINLAGVTFDSMIASHLLGMPSHSLDNLAISQLQHEMIPISSLIGERGRDLKQRTMDQVPIDQITPYAAEDADISLRLYELFTPQLRTMGLDKLATDVEMSLVEVLARIERHGIKLNPDELDRQKENLSKRIEQVCSEIYEAADQTFNIDSPKQLADVLFNKMKLPVIKRTKTGPSTDIEVMEKLADLNEVGEQNTAIARLIVEYRQLRKLVNTFLINLRNGIDNKTGRIHATFHQMGAATGRLSSSNPNLQNIPIRTDTGRQIRKAFIADQDHQLICADYSQIELRILAHLSGDLALTEAFKTDQDIHAAVAARVFNVDATEITSDQRGHAKTINFGIIYGITAYGLSRRIDGLDVDDAKQLIDDYRSQFPGIDTFLRKCIQQATDLGYVTTMMARRRPIPQIQSRNGNTRALGERLAINSVVQGSAADLIKLAMVNLDRRIRRQNLSLKMILQIHDELVFEAPQDQAKKLSSIVREEMEGAMMLNVPLKVDVGIATNWLIAK